MSLVERLGLAVLLATALVAPTQARDEVPAKVWQGLVAFASDDACALGARRRR